VPITRATSSPVAGMGRPVIVRKEGATRRDRVDEQMTSEDDIRPLFRDRDVSSMSFAFDLSSYDDARANAEPIYERVAAGTMPCDGHWPAEDVERFRTWIDNGIPP
jgi:hypothetical protein